MCIGIQRVGGYVPIHLVCKTEPDNVGTFGEDGVHGSGNCLGVDLVKRYPGLEGHDIDCASAGGVGSCVVHLRIAVVGAGCDLGILAVGARFCSRLGFGFDGHYVDSIG